jgi:hypothetical protein
MPTIWPIADALQHHYCSQNLAVAIGKLLPAATPVLDLGCGMGTYLAYLKTQGFQCQGVEGTPDIQSIAHFPEIITADLAQPLELDWPRSSVLCLEVGEHLEPHAEAQLLDTIDRYCDSWLILSWAIPGQAGLGHINCQPNDHIRDQMRQRGFESLEQETALLRAADDPAAPWFRNTIMVFRKTPNGPSGHDHPGHVG